MTIYPIETFHRAIADSPRSYRFDKVRYTDHSGEVRKVEGSVTLLKRIVFNGMVQFIPTEKKLRWDGTGHCFSPSSNVRQRKYDLPLASYADANNKEKEV